MSGLDLEQIRRDARRVVAELHAWAKRDLDGWGVARARDGRRRSYSPDTSSARYRESALRGSRRAGALTRGRPQ